MLSQAELQKEDLRSEIKLELVDTRDDEIRLIIDRITDETHKQKREVEQECAERLKWLQESHESELRNMH